MKPSPPKRNNPKVLQKMKSRMNKFRKEDAEVEDTEENPADTDDKAAGEPERDEKGKSKEAAG